MKKKLSLVSLILALSLFFMPILNAKAAVSLPVLKKGSSGANVYALQYLLRNKSISVSADGIFGSGTETGVKQFQKSNGLSVDGIVGNNTWNKLFVVVKNGSKNDAVKAVQYLLKSKYGYSLTVDGIFGSGTESIVKQFQKSKGLSADGIVGTNTWNALLTGQGTASNDNFWSKRTSWVHPIKGGCSVDCTIGGRNFGASRSNGRAHAGVDFIAPAGTKVLSMTSGKVIEVTSNFYAGTGSIVIKNSDGTIARYCEVKPSLSVGATVKAGQVIATVQKSTTGSQMLHLEMYMGTASGALTNTSNKSYTYVTNRNYQRRSDLIDPTGAKNLKVQK